MQFPVLETAQGSLCESAAISRYIASLGQNNLYPLPLNPTGKYSDNQMPCLHVTGAMHPCDMPCHVTFGMQEVPCIHATCHAM